MMRNKKIIRIDFWDITLVMLFFIAAVVIYWYPSINNPTLNQQFFFNLADRSFGYLMFGIVLKKVIDKSYSK